MYAASC